MDRSPYPDKPHTPPIAAAPSDTPLIDAFPDTIRFVRNPRARRYILRVDRQGVRVTIPRGGSESFARRFVATKADWIRIQRTRRAARLRTPESWGPGTAVWYRGERHPLARDGTWGHLANRRFPCPPPDTDWRPAVEAHLRRMATAELPPLTLDAASRFGVIVKRVSVRAQCTRWGSCSRRGTVSLNWRLVQAPLSVRDYLIAHELAHLREMNHSHRFWRVVASFFPAWRDAETWLRLHGRDLLD